jgi:hypothetical protein
MKLFYGISTGGDDDAGINLKIMGHFIALGPVL